MANVHHQLPTAPVTVCRYETSKDIATRVEKLPVKVRHVDAHVPKSRANEEHQNNEQVDQAAKIEVSKIDLDWQHKGELFLARWAHDASGHQGRDATYKWARDRGVDLTMDSISQVIHDCETCAAIKQAKRVKPLWYGGRWSKYKYGEAWQIDYITLPQTRQGKRYVLTMVEATTGWLETYPVPHATARNTILGLEKQVLWRHGTPERIESDNGTHFKVNSLWHVGKCRVKKPDGSYRLVQDLTEVNKRTRSHYPVVPNPYTLLSKVPPQHQWFSVVDLKDAFWACPLAKESRDIFAFEWEDPKTGRKQQLRWKKLPQGFTESPNLFGQALEKILQAFSTPPGIQIIQYVDDLLLSGEDEVEVREATIKLLNFLGEKGLRVSKGKLQFVEPEVKEEGAQEQVLEEIALADANEQCKAAILSLPMEPAPTLDDMLQQIAIKDDPKTLFDLQQLCGSINWVRPLLGIMTEDLSPLFNLLQGSEDLNLPWTISPEAWATIDKVQEALSSQQAHRFELSLPFLLSILGHKLFKSTFNLVPKFMFSKTPLKAMTVFTDGSGSSHKSVMIRKDPQTQKWESDIQMVEGSPQIAELAAVVRAFEKFQQPFNLVTDSAYVAGIAMRAKHSFKRGL
ncbi:hypothetical protein DUI87_02944 [Hirundo rustica rustica]|uniref:ribonuclease H n=1 Tax=Hirundo rustica rustica TaxID=333673 RepID=A0A3M0L903_HIRRU|nr:hypothetical protein DUI87_02944 [Hirundo rustica rustica]